MKWPWFLSVTCGDEQLPQGVIEHGAIRIQMPEQERAGILGRFHPQLKLAEGFVRIRHLGVAVWVSDDPVILYAGGDLELMLGPWDHVVTELLVPFDRLTGAQPF